MRDALNRLRMLLDKAIALKAQPLPQASYSEIQAILAGVDAAADEIVRAVSDGAAAPIAELREMKAAFDARWSELRVAPKKLLYRVGESMNAAIERVTFAEMSRGKSAPCDCAIWRAVAAGRGLSAAPSLPASRVVEEVDDTYESYRIHECGQCGSRWLQDFNPDSDPSVTRWWPK